MSKFIAILLSLFILFACREPVEENIFDFTPFPTVNGLLCADSILKLHLSYARQMDALQNEPIENATIVLFEKNMFTDTLNYIIDGIYSSNRILKESNFYKCFISIPGFDTIICETCIPPKPKIISYESIKYAGKDEEGLTYPAISFTFVNDPEIEQYFHAIIRGYEYERNYFWDIHTIDDPLLLAEGLPIALFENTLIPGYSYKMKLNYTTGSSTVEDGSPVMHLYPFQLELRSGSYDYYQYVKQLHFYEMGRFPEFSMTSPAETNLYSNIENAYGIFAGYSKMLSDTINPNQQ